MAGYIVAHMHSLISNSLAHYHQLTLQPFIIHQHRFGAVHFIGVLFSCVKLLWFPGAQTSRGANLGAKATCILINVTSSLNESLQMNYAVHPP